MKRFVISIMIFAATTSASAWMGVISSDSSPLERYKAMDVVPDPVNASSGEHYMSEELFDLGGPLPLRFSIFYSVRQSITRSAFGAFGQRFQMNVPIIANSATEMTVYFLDDGDNHVAFTGGAGNWVQKNPGTTSVPYVLKEPVPSDSSGYVYLMDPVKGLVYIFKRDPAWSTFNCRLYHMVDRNGNRISYTYGSNNHYPEQITDGLGRTLTLTYASQVVSTIADGQGRTWNFTYSTPFPTTANIWQLRDPLNNIRNLSWDSDVTKAIRQATLPRGNTPYVQTYDSSGRVTSQTDAYGNAVTLAYDFSSSAYNEDTPVQTTASWPNSTSTRFTSRATVSGPTAIRDGANQTVSFTRGDSDRVTGMADRLGGSYAYTYHVPSGKIATATNARGKTMTYTYTAQNQTISNPSGGSCDFTFYNLTRVDFPNGSYEQYAYDAKGNMLTRRDRNENTWSWTYNAQGLPLTATNPAGGVTTRTYNADGTVATLTDDDLGAISYTYDADKRLQRITHPGGSFIEYAYDAMGRVTTVTDELSHVTSMQYDANGNLTRITDPLTNFTQYAYDNMDRLSSVTDRLNRTTNLTYNNMSWLASITDPNSLATSYTYDAHGWVTGVTHGGRTWTTAYDLEGLPTSRTSPLGFSTSYATDAQGLVTSITLPSGLTTSYGRDDQGNVSSVTDPLGRTVSYARDGREQPTAIALPTVGTTTPAWNSLGLLSTITDPRNYNWIFTYTKQGRLKTQVDPAGNIWTNTYDNRGRLTGVAYPGGATLANTYDNASNLTRRLYSDGTDLNFTYDNANRLLTGEQITLTRDAEGRVLTSVHNGVTFGATYDNGGRLATATYNNGAITVNYTYDVNGNLSRVADATSGAQVDFTYDNDNRLTGIARSNGAGRPTAFTWDNAGRLTRIQDSGLIDLQYTLDAAGQATRCTATVPIDPATWLVNGNENRSFSSSERVTSSGYAYDNAGRRTSGGGDVYTWDAASRLTGVSGATLTYNALGDVVTRAQGGTTMRQFHNYAFPLPVLAAEKNDAGGFKRFYVYTPAGELLYGIDVDLGNAPRYYHFDRSGATLALTTSTGAVTDSYAYDPFGRLLRHEGPSAQPFTFGGKWGIRQDGDTGTLYQCRARYYDAVTGQFLSREPIWPDLSDPRLINPYQYALNNPLNYTDPSGWLITNSVTKFETSRAWRVGGDLLNSLSVCEPSQPIASWQSSPAPGATPIGDNVGDRSGQFVWNDPISDVRPNFRPSTTVPADRTALRQVTTPSLSLHLGNREAPRKAPSPWSIERAANRHVEWIFRRAIHFSGHMNAEEFRTFLEEQAQVERHWRERKPLPCKNFATRGPDGQWILSAPDDGHGY